MAESSHQSVPPPPFQSMLELGRDPLVKGAFPAHTVYRRTGSPLRPGPAPRLAEASAARVVLGLLQRRFDGLILPAVHADWAHDANTSKRVLRRLLAEAAGSTLVAGALMGFLGARRRPVAICDVVDHPRISAESQSLYPDHALYFKTNLRVADANAGAGRVHDLPMSFWPENYRGDGNAIPWAERPHDVLWLVASNSEARRAAAAQLEPLRAAGVVVDAPESRLDFPDYVARLRQSRLVLSPAGFGHQCWRHFEALMCGALPLISRAPEPRVETLRHAEHAWFYDADASSLVDVVKARLGGAEQTQQWVEAGRTQVLAQQTVNAVAGKILRLFGQQVDSGAPA